jgi:hypothetical protein
MENAKTIKEFLSAVPPSDGDYLPISQPNVFNPITQQNGDTRKITVDAFADYVIAKWQKAHVGIYQNVAFDASPLWLAKNRLLMLNYQIIEIALYQELCNIMWCGAEANATVLFWYKCDVNGTRNVNGLYMRVEDRRGIIGRGAGANAVLKGANNTPYNGNSIGTFKPDVTRSFNMTVKTLGGNSRGFIGVYAVGGYNSLSFVAGNDGNGIDQLFITPEGNFGYETAPATIAWLTCMSY